MDNRIAGHLELLAHILHPNFIGLNGEYHSDIAPEVGGFIFICFVRIRVVARPCFDFPFACKLVVVYV